MSVLNDWKRMFIKKWGENQEMLDFIMQVQRETIDECAKRMLPQSSGLSSGYIFPSRKAERMKDEVNEYE